MSSTKLSRVEGGHVLEHNSRGGLQFELSFEAGVISGIKVVILVSLDVEF